MQPDEPTNSNQFNASLPLPDNAAGLEYQEAAATNTAADLIRQKVAAAYANAPDAAQEALDTAELGPAAAQSSHQKFMYELTASGKPLPEIQAAWHEYYAGLSDVQKHQVWQEFYDMHARASRYPAAAPAMAPKTVEPERPIVARRLKPSGVGRTLADLRSYALGTVGSRSKPKPAEHFQSLLFGLGVGAAVILIFLFSFFNERFIAPFIQPSRNVTNTPIINQDSAIGSNPEIIIPKINVEIPVVYGVTTISEADVDKALENGVVHYADTALPGQNGNLVIVGHSSNNIFNKGRYKFAFVLLSRMESGDVFYLHKDGKRYTYQVYQKSIVKPTDVSVLAASDKPATATLITCDPPGTSTNRLVVVGQQISPDPGANLAASSQNSLAAKSAIIPGNAESLWSRLLHLLSR